MQINVRTSVRTTTWLSQMSTQNKLKISYKASHFRWFCLLYCLSFFPLIFHKFSSKSTSMSIALICFIKWTMSFALIALHMLDRIVAKMQIFHCFSISQFFCLLCCFRFINSVFFFFLLLFIAISLHFTASD